MNHTNEHIEQLILRQLSGEASEAELAELQQWLDASPANREEYESLRQIWASSLTALQPEVFDTAAAWKKMEGVRSGAREEVRSGAMEGDRGGVIEMGALPEGRPELRWRLRWRPVMAAAGVLLLVVYVSMLYKHLGAPTMKKLEATNATEPVSLPDGSIVWLRKGSALQYPSSFTNFRLVELTGDAYFEVRDDAAKVFRVKTQKGLIEVLGTSFAVGETDGEEKVLVTTGRIRFRDRGAAERQLVLAAGESATLMDGGLTKDSRPRQNMVAWKTNTLEFSNTPLPAVLADLRDLYGIRVGLSPELRDTADKIQINARFSYTEKPAEVLEEIRLMTGLSVRRQMDTVIFFHP